MIHEPVPNLQDSPDMGNQELRSPPLWHDSGRIRQLNDYFLSLGTDYAANIQRLAQAAGDLLAAACAFSTTS